MKALVLCIKVAAKPIKRLIKSVALARMSRVDKWSNDINVVARQQNGQGLERKLAVSLQ